MRALTSAPPPGAPACAVLAGSLRPPERAASILYDRPAMLEEEEEQQQQQRWESFKKVNSTAVPALQPLDKSTSVYRV